ncbi:Nuclear transport factor 2 [Galemys pyrenaicus]|uniref:Nuclear transport factor 2 n=1 Tax=Galemys pyrenaicus TaxID=202257 RepID=A0A8J6AHE6_GALPY|nr:Nuclear transport factor 2 [Galemys pyrenaicus]
MWPALTLKAVAQVPADRGSLTPCQPGPPRVSLLFYQPAPSASQLRRHFQGKAAIVEKWSRRLFQKIQHITAQSHQPPPDGSILSVVVAHVKGYKDPPLGFDRCSY